ncbi:MAG: colanic acid biosynthesis glycosyltransferase WcaL [Acidobacteria bacterium]|nr:MAG: colanic acid biosynthesis glycosyltransferase WcaL [Acidobacteriota bacterium]
MQKRVAYLVSRFPKISETFILNEIIELEKLGVAVEIFPLIQHQEPVRHPEADALVARAHYTNLFSGAVLSAQFYWLRSSPIAYLKAWHQAIRGNLTSPKFLGRAFVIIPLAAYFAQVMQKLQIKHVHAHWATHPALAAYVIKILTGISYSITAHAHDIYVDRTMLAEKIRDANFVVTISEFNKRLLTELYGKDTENKIAVIRCGVDTDVLNASERSARTQLFRILCIGSLEERKGQRYLVAACAKLKKSGIRFECLLAGDGDQRGRLLGQIREQGLRNEVRLLGWQTANQVRALLAQADVMVLPSTSSSNGKTEGIPVALMEAMSMRVPVIATNISGIPELVQDRETGLLVPDRDVESLVTALKQLHVDEQLRANLGNNARLRIQLDFNLQKNVLSLYRLFSPESVATSAEAYNTGSAARQTRGEGNYASC